MQTIQSIRADKNEAEHIVSAHFGIAATIDAEVGAQRDALFAEIKKLANANIRGANVNIADAITARLK